ncbi:hypothetical protein [Brevundimonas bacteroides]|uniref:hypothetical protein n=1 Tax=Brevundimonas bacteroides TaxID=74311 RepID=UPI00054E669B|nr:hypothetical protein [Brevundimonas bacteroides]
MTIQRRLNPGSGVIELWWVAANSEMEGESHLLGEEEPLSYSNESVANEEVAICWAQGRTLGNVEIRSPRLLNQLAAKHGDKVNVPCDFVYAGKFRHGVDRWWCRTHQNHWGTKADIAALQTSGLLRCVGHAEPMNYLVGPFSVNLDAHAEVGVWCSLPAALSTQEIKPRPPQIHVHVRDAHGAMKLIDRDFPAISATYTSRRGFLTSGDTNRVDITPPAAFEFVCALESHKELGCIDCSHCGQPHLDLGDFGKTPHRKHFCANCGRDSTWSKGPIISTPLKPLHDRSATHLTCVMPDRGLNLDDFKGCNYRVWASTPAIVWTAARPQEYGIHVHVHNGTERIIDDTFGEVIVDGRVLVREELLQMMIRRAIV